LIGRSIEQLKEEISENTAFKIIEVKGAEADDVIAIIAKLSQTHDCIMGGFEPKPQPVILVTTDGDAAQLLIYKNVQQWDNVNGKFITVPNPRHTLIEHICTGDAGDNVPNILTGDSWADTRALGEKPPNQKPFMKTRLPEFYEKGIDACKDDNERRNYRRNEMLVSKGSFAKMRNYFMEHRMKNCLENIQIFK